MADSKIEADELEIFLIKEFDCMVNGYNVCLGGGGSLGRKHTEAAKELCRQAAYRAKSKKGIKKGPITDEHRANNQSI